MMVYVVATTGLYLLLKPESTLSIRLLLYPSTDVFYAETRIGRIKSSESKQPLLKKKRIGEATITENANARVRAAYRCKKKVTGEVPPKLGAVLVDGSVAKEDFSSFLR